MISSDGYSLNDDCLQNVFPFLNFKSLSACTRINRDFYTKTNDFWKKNCPQFLNSLAKIDLKTPSSVRDFFMQKGFNEEITQNLRQFLSTEAQGKIEFRVGKRPFLSFEMNDPANSYESKLPKIIQVRSGFVQKLIISPVNKEYKTYPSVINPFFVITHAQFEQVSELSVPFKKFLEKQHEEIGCKCQKNENCERFIEKVKKEMIEYFKEAASFNEIEKKIAKISLKTFNSQDQINIVAETFPLEIKAAYERYLVFNRKIKQGMSFKLIFEPYAKSTCIVC